MMKSHQFETGCSERYLFFASPDKSYDKACRSDNNGISEFNKYAIAVDLITIQIFTAT